MKRPLLVSFAIFLFLTAQFLNYSISFSQTPDFNQTYRDYTYTYSLYRESHNLYLSAKGEYQTYKTLNAEAKAFEATRDMLQKRAETLKAYFALLRTRLLEKTNITNYQQNVSYVKLDGQMGWLASHKDTLEKASSLSELLSFSLELEQRSPDAEILSYQTLGIILISQEVSLEEKLSQEANKVEEKIDQMKQEGEDVEKLKRWLAQAREKINLAKEKRASGESRLKTMSESYDRKYIFNEAQPSFVEANQYLKEATAYLKEIIEEIKHE